MALGQALMMEDVKTVLGQSTNDKYTLCRAVSINKWSRFKPVRGAWPQSINGKFGLDLADGWNYLKPRGNSVSPEEPAWLDQFAGYEHDKDFTGPVIFCLAGDIIIASSITPSLTDNVATGEWKHKANLAPHNNVKILPSDIGIENYYCGLHLQIGTLNFYKTGTQVNAIGAGGQVIGFDARITNIDSKAFEDFPSGEVGSYTWKLFVSSSQHSSWTTTTPTNYIELPGLTGETVGSKSIKSRGTFVMNPWLIAGDSNTGGNQVSQFIWAYNDTAVKSIYLFRAGSIPPGLNAIHEHFEIAAAYQGGDGGNLVTNDSDAWDDGTRIDIRPKTQNNGSEINGDAVFGFEITHHTAWGSQVTIHLRHEGGALPSATWREDETWSFVTNTINSGLTIGSTNLNLSIALSGSVWPDDVDVRIYRGSNETTLLHSSTVHIGSDGVMSPASANFALSSAIVAGDIIIIRVGAAV